MKDKKAYDFNEAAARMSANEGRHYWFSKKAAYARFARGGGICSGIFNRKRRAFTHSTLDKIPPNSFTDFKYVGFQFPDSLKFVGGIPQNRYEVGLLDRDPSLGIPSNFPLKSKRGLE